MRRQRIENLRREPPRAVHAGEALGPVQLDDAVLRFGAVVGGDGDVLSYRMNIGPESLKRNRTP